MIIEELLKTNHMTMYRLSKMTNIPQSTVSDICSGKTSLKKCSSWTVYKISKALNVSMDKLLEEIDYEENSLYSLSFDTFKSTVCHTVKEYGDLKFIADTLTSNVIRQMFDERKYPESLYLLAMVDYLSRENHIPLYKNYNDIRSGRLKNTLYPSSIIAKAVFMKDDSIKEKAKKESIPEFIRFNIVEAEVRNIV